MKPVILNSMKKLSSSESIENCILMDRKGNIKIKSKNLEKDKASDFSTLIATILGTAIESNKVIETKFPKKISIEDVDGFTIIRVIDKNNILVVRAGSNSDIDNVLEEIETARWNMLRGL